MGDNMYTKNEVIDYVLELNASNNRTLDFFNTTVKLFCQKKLSNERFVQNAPNQVIVLERKKESDTLSKIKTILTSLDRLK